MVSGILASSTAMHLIANIASWAFHNRLGLWSVVLGALFLAGLDHAARMRRMRAFDAWWFFNLHRPATGTPGRASRGSKPRRAPRDGESPDGRQPRSTDVEPTN